MEVAISTVDRYPQLVHGTLDSLYLRGGDAARSIDLRLVVSGGSGAYLGNPWLSGDTSGLKVGVEVASGAELERIESVPPEGRCLLNFRRQLGDGEGAILCLQDDVIFTKGWLGKLELLIEQIDNWRGALERHDSYALSLYCAYRFKRQPFDIYHAHLFYGNQALYLSERGRDVLRRYLDDEISLGRPKSDDMMVKDAALNPMVKFDIYAAIPNLVQHVGESSSLGLRFHSSPTFRP